MRYSYRMAMSLRLPDPLIARLDALAARTGRSKTFYVLQAVTDHIDDLEDVYLAEQRLTEHRATGGHAFTLDEVERELDLDS